jgi:TldD protein
MQNLTQSAVDTALAAGATYADARVVSHDHERVKTKNGHLDAMVRGDSRGLGVRVIVDGCWGFAASSDLSPSGVAATARRAVDVARASRPCALEPVLLAPVTPSVAEWRGPCAQDPFAVSAADKLAFLMDLDARMMATPDVNVAEAEVNSFRDEKWFAGSEGARIYQHITQCGGLLQATAVGNGEVQTRSFPSALEGYHAQAG